MPKSSKPSTNRKAIQTLPLTLILWLKSLPKICMMSYRERLQAWVTHLMMPFEPESRIQDILTSRPLVQLPVMRTLTRLSKSSSTLSYKSEWEASNQVLTSKSINSSLMIFLMRFSMRTMYSVRV